MEGKTNSVAIHTTYEKHSSHMYKHTYTHAFTHIHIHPHIYIYVCTHAYSYIHMHTDIHTHKPTWKQYTYTCGGVYTYTYTHIGCFLCFTTLHSRFLKKKSRPGSHNNGNTTPTFLNYINWLKGVGIWPILNDPVQVLYLRQGQKGSRAAEKFQILDKQPLPKGQEEDI